MAKIGGTCKTYGFELKFHDLALINTETIPKGLTFLQRLPARASTFLQRLPARAHIPARASRKGFPQGLLPLFIFF